MHTLWIDALDFKEYGGFVRETQFVREMGQGYLIADGAGMPVCPAKTSFSVLEAGMYRFFIRTKNWCPDYAPDGLQIVVDGVKSEHICGKMHSQGWYFEIAADFDLKAGEHKLEIFNTDGWFARFAAVVITGDYNFYPSRDVEKLLKQRALIKGIKSDIQKSQFELIVVGGGVAGITAAITAARYGVKTALVNDRPILGGNGSDEAHVTLEGSAHKGYHETGVIFEIKNYKENSNLTWSHTFENFCNREDNLTVYNNLLVDGAVKVNDRITEITATETLNYQKYLFTADNFIDATGDAWLGYYADAEYKIGREAKFEFGESAAPDLADGNTMSGCATCAVTDNSDTICSYFAEELDEPCEFKAPEWAFKLPEGDALGREPHYIDRGHWWLEMPNDYDDIWESEFVRDSMLRMSVGYFDWLKNSWSKKEKAKNFKLKKLGLYNAKRESRRLMGDYILTENDYVMGKHFDDAVCYSGWNIDVHHVGGIFSGSDGMFTIDKVVPITPIPFRALYSKNVENLMMVGRCISVSHIGLGPIRVQLTGATMGQAVATAAYLCKKYNKNPKEIGINNIKELQQLVIKDGLMIPGFNNTDGEDIAKKATVFADSYIENGNPENIINGKTRLTDGQDYAWISSKGFPQGITLEFGTEMHFSEIRITFDFPFADYKQCFLPSPKPTNLVCDFDVEIFIDGEWKNIASVRDNFQRLCVLKFNIIKAKKIKVTILKTVESDFAVIPEIRVY